MRDRSMVKRLLCLTLVLLPAVPGSAQTIEDGLMMPKKALCTGFLYGYDRWDEYWEGTLKRDNGNVGTLTTQSVGWMGTYGVTDRLNLISMVPYVWTHASAGTLEGQKGFQDLTIAAKYRLIGKESASGNAFRTFLVGMYSVPLTNYVPDLYPLSIGPASQHLGGRVTLNYTTKGGWYLNATTAYTWRGNVTLDRPAYFTNGQLFLTNEVEMPNAFEYSFSAGYVKDRVTAPVSFSQHRTLGGGDIRRQDMPFVSNRMNMSKLDALVKYDLARPRNLSLQLQVAQVVTGRNVGQSSMLMAGLLYTFHF
jgi:hypothetical protein